MSINGLARTICLTGLLIFCCGLSAASPAGSAKRFRISAVQENQVWIEGGLIDGLEKGMESEIGYEISVAGQKKRIIPAKVRLSIVEDRESLIKAKSTAYGRATLKAQPFRRTVDAGKYCSEGRKRIFGIGVGVGMGVAI